MSYVSPPSRVTSGFALLPESVRAAYARGMRIPTACLVGALLSACGAGESRFDPEVAFEEGEPGTVTQGMLVSEVTGCSTAVVSALSQQLVDAVNCARPETLEKFAHPSVTTGSAVWPYLQPPAKDALLAAVDEQGGSMQVNSAYRTLVQQYLLYTWYQRGQCNIALAARPGRSNHESGLALDVQDHDAWRTTLESFGWLWLGNSDPVHFDFEGGGTVSLSELSVLSFQQLWNRNNPDDLIDEDGLYGPQTEARIQQAPIEGFPLPLCAPEEGSGEPTGSGGEEPGSGGDGEIDLAALGCSSSENAGGGAALLLALVLARRR